MCGLDLSDRPRLANQHEQTRHTNLSTIVQFYPTVLNHFTFRELWLVEGARLIVHKIDR